ncbi:MAG: DNA-binding HxlR family transcriptional regulator [Myxococcota bacterium]|jgi:DNA-binding HxlR family transcriptional regulator
MALDVVGQRWTLLLIRELLPGPRRFTDLRLPGLTPNVLSDRLTHLSDAGLIERFELPPPAARSVWALTARGRELEPAILALGAFGAAYLQQPSGLTLSHRWMMVSLQRRYPGGAPEGVVHLTLGDTPYTVTIDPVSAVVRDGHLGTATASLTGPVMDMAGVLARGQPIGAGTQVNGDGGYLQHWLSVLTRVR